MDLGSFILKIMITCKVLLFKAGVKGKAESLKLMEVTMKGRLKITKQMGMGNTMVMMDIGMKANGKTIYPTGQGKQIMKMEADMLGSF